MALTKAAVAEKYMKYEYMACRIAIGLAGRHGVPVAELCDEARSILGLALANNWTHDPRMSGEQTWVYQNVYWPLLTYCTRGRPRMSSTEDIPAAAEPAAPPARLANLLRDLSDEARALVECIINAPGDLIEDITRANRRRAKAVVTEHLARAHGLFPFEIDAAWREVEAAL